MNYRVLERVIARIQPEIERARDMECAIARGLGGLVRDEALSVRAEFRIEKVLGSKSA